MRSRLPSDPAFAVPAFVSPACAANLWEGYTSKGTLLAFKAARHHYSGPIPYAQASRFRPIFQVLFCRFFAGRPMLRPHDLFLTFTTVFWSPVVQREPAERR